MPSCAQRIAEIVMPAEAIIILRRRIVGTVYNIILAAAVAGEQCISGRINIAAHRQHACKLSLPQNAPMAQFNIASRRPATSPSAALKTIDIICRWRFTPI